MKKEYKSIMTRLTKEEYEQLKEKANQANISIYKYIQQSLKKSRIISSYEIEMQRNKLNSISKIGNNLNQIAKNLNILQQKNKENINSVIIFNTINNLKTDLENINNQLLKVIK